MQRKPIRELEVHSFRGEMLDSPARQVGQFAPGYAQGIYLVETAG